MGLGEEKKILVGLDGFFGRIYDGLEKIGLHYG